MLKQNAPTRVRLWPFRDHSIGGNVAPERKWMTNSAIVTRADGSIENRGIISFSHRNPFINAIGSRLARFNGWVWERYYRFRNWRKSS